jgi:hypothetical protein
LAEARKLGVEVDAYWHPPAADREIAETAAMLPFELPSDILDFYRWQDGVHLDGYTPGFGLIPRFVFPSVRESVDTTLSLVDAADDPDVRWQKTWYALATDLFGDYLSVETSGSSPNYGRLFAIVAGCEPYPAFSSFKCMLASVLECYKAAAYFLHEDGFLDERREQSHLIYRALNKELSPLHLHSKEERTEGMRRAKRQIEMERRPDLLQKLRDMCKGFGLDFDDL